MPMFECLIQPSACSNIASRGLAADGCRGKSFSSCADEYVQLYAPDFLFYISSSVSSSDSSTQNKFSIILSSIEQDGLRTEQGNYEEAKKLSFA